MNTHEMTRGSLLFIEAYVAVTSILGGTVLVVGAFLPDRFSTITPPTAYLDGSPFTSYLVPGLVLALVVGGLNAFGFVMLLRRRPLALFAAAASGYAVLIWIFVQMTIIPFSVLQAVYFFTGAIELGLVLILLGIVPMPVESASDARARSTASAGRLGVRDPHRQEASAHAHVQPDE